MGAKEISGTASIPNMHHACPGYITTPIIKIVTAYLNLDARTLQSLFQSVPCSEVVADQFKMGPSIYSLTTRSNIVQIGLPCNTPESRPEQSPGRLLLHSVTILSCMIDVIPSSGGMSPQEDHSLRRYWDAGFFIDFGVTRFISLLEEGSKLFGDLPVGKRRILIALVRQVNIALGIGCLVRYGLTIQD
jgi:hypothetical protein